jgi:1-acyl-sn-glycerol-3-phosphate acyltransferase
MPMRSGYGRGAPCWPVCGSFRLRLRSVQAGCDPERRNRQIDVLRRGEVILIFPSGTRGGENAAFKRGAATVALHARVPLVPAFYQGPKHMDIAHIMHRPRIRVTFGAPIPTASLPLGKETTAALTRQLQAAIGELENSDLCAA